jgi:O-methyltransferase
MSTLPLTSRVPLETFLRTTDFPADLASFIKYEFDKHLYYYGAHFSNGYDRSVNGRNADTYRTELIEFFWKHQPALDAELAKSPVNAAGSAPCIFSHAYFGWDQPLANIGVRLIRSPWIAPEAGNALSVAIFTQCRAVQELLRLGFSVFYDRQFYTVLKKLAENLEQFFSVHPARGILMPFTNGFFEGVTTRIFKKLGKSTFLCIHGIPARLDWWKNGENPVDYLVVWGDALKRRIVEHGRPADTVLVSGHPSYSGREFKKISTSLERVLVLSYAQPGAPMLDHPYFHDRSRSLDYLWRVQVCLQKAGVKNARVRPHPSESPLWYKMHLDPDFYQVDEGRSLADSLAQTTLIVGPTSTVAIDAAVVGVNYVTFTPDVSHYNPLGDPLFSPDLPFDGSDARFPVAKTEDTLVALLKKSATIDSSALLDYLSSAFQAEVVVNALKLVPVASLPVGKKSVPASTTAASSSSTRQLLPLHIPEAAEVPAKQFELQTLATVRPFTMTPPEVTLNAMRAVAIAVERGLEGAVVECGVWRGGVSMAMMHQLKKLGARREFFMYDTYDGMSEPTEEDLSPAGEAASKLLAEHRKDEANHYWAFAPMDRVRRNIESVGYPMELVRMVQGKVEDTIPGVVPDRIAVLRLDTDWYESTKHELDHLYSRLIPGGIMILDDYGFWQGARKAVDEFFATLTEKPVLHVVHDNLNSCVRWCVKP